ncbi:hypothetical protein A4H97_03375 [Niastella yeongjuensis]|uniref:DUF3592 domain-containing protein n=1 Tax=Niastella yeongjuensis TaxID=354355 RepID=A0A1V9EXP5_9BACT|nr:DUF3592 domain-containing protein [Niastella yeongjuensis]OQP50879.1 hypothetical protein A4H97_03375 [Niastella yeongjuensis]SEN13421.1 hypothetical protein SAMN05660816_00265 [Niastella yeongjuensis]
MILKIAGITTLLTLLVKYMLAPLFKELLLYFHLKKHGVKTVGSIVDVEECIDLDNFKSYKGIIEFTTNDNTICRYVLTDSKMDQPDLGKKVNLIYDPENISRVIINETGAFAFLVVKIFFLLFIFLGIFAGIFFLPDIGG